MGKQRPTERRAPACGHAPGQRWCWSPPAVPRGPLPTSLRRQGWGRKSRAAGLAEGGRGDTHRKRHCSWSCDSKKHRMPSSPPDNCGRCGGSRRSLAHACEGQGSQVRAEGPAPHPGPVITWPLLTTPPEPLRWLEVSCMPHRLCSRCQLPFQSMSYSHLAQVAPPPGSPSLSNPGQMPPLQLTQPLWVSPTTALTSWSLPHQTGSEPPCTHRAGRGGLSIETVSRTPRP